MHLPNTFLRYTSSVTLAALYGHHVVSLDDELIRIAEDAAEVVSNKIGAGSKIWAVDILPFRK